MNEIEFQKLREASWRRELTAQEEAALKIHLAENPETRFEWREEAGLSELLAKLPDAPVSTNFTARVLQEVQRGAGRDSRRDHGIFHWLRFHWLPRIAVAGLVVCGGFLSVQQYKRAQIAQDIKIVSSAATAALPQHWLEDFDAINRLSQPPVDNELLAALQ